VPRRTLSGAPVAGAQGTQSLTGQTGRLLTPPQGAQCVQYTCGLRVGRASPLAGDVVHEGPCPAPDHLPPATASRKAKLDVRCSNTSSSGGISMIAGP